ncbi:polysaccharide biosynthesis protein [Dyadobacter sandarakinus]|uniref:Polysaccharide biosynthesis protein n=1 Tax=Dyadobacter sandarakinus TaxID=2747268 RepID=A0ABX7I9S7_9BACT|nr:polysaccharide biosynthesis protein [Dyadobacter sandarakinus]QRR02735.1 polysaccharide biosynthesis protein [Dyadobacter sandarakinus]
MQHNLYPDPEKLLGRQEQQYDLTHAYHAISGKTILLTGAAGSIGQELVKHILDLCPKMLILVDQAETALCELIQKPHVQVSLTSILHFVADITDLTGMRRIFQQQVPDIIFHAAAYKHVTMMQNQPYEALRTNVLGTHVLVQVSLQFRVGKFVFISTDKAVNPSGIMGSTKRLAELYLLAVSRENPETIFVITRFGNVLGSAGSCIPRFLQQIREGRPMTITHPEVCRYFMTFHEAFQTVLEAAGIGKTGEILIAEMGAPVRIRDLAAKFAVLCGIKPADISMHYFGLQPGEKLREDLWHIFEQRKTANSGEVSVFTSPAPAAGATVIARQVEQALQTLTDQELIFFVKTLIKKLQLS